MLSSVFGERVYTLGHSAAGGIGLLYAARSTALLNLRCEDALRGRVFAADMMLFTLATIVAIFVAGRLLDGAGLIRGPS